MTIRKLITVIKEDHPVDIVRYLERFFNKSEIKWLIDNYIVTCSPTSEKLIFDENKAKNFLNEDLPLKTSDNSLGSIFEGIVENPKQDKKVKLTSLNDDDLKNLLTIILGDPSKASKCQMPISDIDFPEDEEDKDESLPEKVEEDNIYIVRLKDELIEVQLFVDNLKCRYKKLKKFIEENDKYNSLTFYQKSNMEAQRDFMKKSLKFLKKYLEVLRYRTLDTVPNFD